VSGFCFLDNAALVFYSNELFLDKQINQAGHGFCPTFSRNDDCYFASSRKCDCRAHCFGLADGPAQGNFDTMKTTIDHAGRLVIPKDIRCESGIKPGMPLEVRWEKGAIAITPSRLAVKLERKGRLLVAVSTKDTPRLSADTVERTRKVLRKERSADSA
jgi:AbrB family looped-hinge helix DNA binding protein